MSRKASPVLIGTFVLGGIALLVVALLAFGGRELFLRKQRFVTYFDSSVQGLRVGSNVLFRGVRVGYVTDISLSADMTMLNFQIPVTFELIPEAFSLAPEGDGPNDRLPGWGQLDQLIMAGLRAQLNSESFVTGQLVVDLDMHPDTPVVFRGKNPPYPEIPSIPSDIARVFAGLQRFLANIQNKVPIDEIMADLRGTLEGLNRLVNSPELEQTLAGIDRLINAREMQEFPTTLSRTLGELRAAASDTRTLARDANARLDPVVERAVAALEQLQSTLREGEKVLGLARHQLDSSPEAAAELAKAFKEVERSARAIRMLVDYLERHPEALLRGKAAPE